LLGTASYNDGNLVTLSVKMMNVRMLAVCFNVRALSARSSRCVVMRLILGIVIVAVITPAYGPAVAQDNISKFLLIKLTREQSMVFCESDVFTDCMGFSQQQCAALSESAINTCLEPLPDRIDPETLSNDTLEACPLKIYEEAGFSEEKAKSCFAQAVDGS